MPIRYARSYPHRLAVIVITGSFDPADLFRCLEQHRAEGGWAYGILCDLRPMTDTPTHEALREFTDMMVVRPLREWAGGPVAILTTDLKTYNRACVYADMAKAYATIQVFQDEADAEAWLSKSTRVK